MQTELALLGSSALFAGISGDNLETILGCLDARRQTFAKGETVYFEGDAVTDIGLLLDGRLHLLKSDVWGNTAIVAEATPPDLFAEAVVCAGAGQLPLSVVAKEPSTVLFLDYRRIVTTCSSACAFHAKLIRNMISVLARRNIQLTDKLEHMTKRSTKDKLLSYLYSQARLKNGKSFDIPFNRQELADYLCVERSALSAELGKLKAAGVLDFYKNHFKLLGGAI